MNLLSCFLLLFYLLFPVYLPAFGAVDSNGSKFLALGILNLVTFTWLVTGLRRRQLQCLVKPFFRTGIGIVCSLFLAAMLVSFFNAVNLPAALMHFTKTFSVFLAVFFFFMFLRLNRNAVMVMMIILTLLVLVDAVTVFYGIGRFMTGAVESVYDIQSGYTNKNILAAAIFLKMAAAVWLVYFSRGWKRRLGTLALFSGMLAIFFLSTRAYYLAMAMLAFILLLYALIRYKRAGERAPARHFLRYTGLLLLALLTYTAIQRYAYPKEKDTYNYNQTVVARVAEIKTEVAKTNQPAGIRLSSWQRTLQLIRQSPVAGVGAGNWKVAVLQYENLERNDFRYLLYNHNDFAEITAETGLLGGTLFVLLFILVFYFFTRAVFTRSEPVRPRKLASDIQAGASGPPPAPDERLPLLFFAATGMMGYAVDAFFNYPADRPEIQILFALFLATAIQGSRFKVQGSRFKVQSSKSFPSFSIFHFPFSISRWSALLHTGLMLALIASVVLFWLNFRMLRMEERVRQDDADPWMSLPSSRIIDGFSPIPDLTSLTEPVAVIKGRYLVRDTRYREAIGMLLPDRSSPWDGRREFWLSKAYARMGMADSAAYWLDRAKTLKPLCRWDTYGGR